MKPFTIIAAMVCGIYLLLEWTEGGKVCYYTTTIDETGATKWTRDKGDCDVIKFGGVKTTATPITGKTVQESEEPTTAVTTEPQGTTPGKTVQESKEPTTAVTTEPQGTTLGKTVQESGEATTAVTTEPQGTTLGKFVQESEEPTTAVTTEPQGTTLGKTVQESKEPTAAVTTESQGTTLGKTVQESEEPTTAVTTEPQGTTLGKTMQETKEPTTAVTTEPQGTTLVTTEETRKPSSTELPSTTPSETTQKTKPPSTPELPTTTSHGTTEETIKLSTTQLPTTTSPGTTEETIKPSTTELPTTTSPGWIHRTIFFRTTEETIKPSTTELSTTTSPGTAQHTIKPSTTESPTTTPPVLYSDCKDVYDAGYTHDGVYKILPAGWPGSAFHVYCKMDNGGGWTVFQRRIDGTTDFYQNWDTYKIGFGDVSANFWLGNDKIHYLTAQKNYKLRFDITTSGGQSQYAEYTEFAIESETTKYRMNKLGSHSGNAGTELSRSKGSSFSTHDNDNDDCSSFNCAEKNKSGWWYMDDWCSDCSGFFCSSFQVHSCYYTCTGENLNGVYNGGSGQNIFSSDFVYCNIKFVEMKIRPTG